MYVTQAFWLYLLATPVRWFRGEVLQRLRLLWSVDCHAWRAAQYISRRGMRSGETNA